MPKALASPVNHLQDARPEILEQVTTEANFYVPRHQQALPTAFKGLDQKSWSNGRGEFLCPKTSASPADHPKVLD